MTYEIRHRESDWYASIGLGLILEQAWLKLQSWSTDRLIFNLKITSIF